MKKLWLFSSLFALFTSLCFSQGTWKTIASPAPDSNQGVMLLLTDGTVMSLTATNSNSSNDDGNVWDLLTPDASGSYTNGTWSVLPPMNNGRLYIGSDVLPSGQVYIAGGEYGSGGNKGEVYDPVAGTWTLINDVPASWTIYDGNSELLYDGTVMQGVQISNTPGSMDNLIFHPSTNLYDSIMPCFGSHDEASWVKLPDSSVMNVDMGTRYSERYIPQIGKWIVDDSLPVDLYDPGLFETGPGFLLPDGRLFFIGDVQYTAYYTPTGSQSKGSWASGPAMPTSVSAGQLGSPDGAGAMMVNGHILAAFAPAGTYNNPAFFYDFNYLTNTWTRLPAPGGSGKDSLDEPSYYTNMLALPDGSILESNQGSNRYYTFKPTGAPLAAGKPTIDNIIPDCPNFVITGKLFNGIGEGANYGDDWQMSTNYPIVRLTSGTNVYYAKTSNWNRIGAVMTGSLEDTADFSLPPAIPAGTYSVVVAVNGNPSDPYTLTLPCVTTDVQKVQNIPATNISVYPNPANDEITVHLTGSSNAVSIQLYSVTGQMLTNFKPANGAYQVINTKSIANGVYLLKVQTEDANTFVKRVEIIK